ncbi:hypothetical protein GA0115256_11242 [Streptomyces sp. DconLS]|nr:hypothetical protein GA0115256_11242 [Streptomyces sp. DconLS]
MAGRDSPGAGVSRRACCGRPFRPADGCLSALRVRPVPGRTGIAGVQWSGRFSPRGATEDEAVALFTGIHRGGLDALDRALAVRHRAGRAGHGSRGRRGDRGKTLGRMA